MVGDNYTDFISIQAIFDSGSFSLLPPFRQLIASIQAVHMSSICPVLVQYMSSDTLDIYWRTAVLFLKSN